MKECSKCRKLLDLSAFYKEPKGRDGLRSCCKACDLVQKAAWRNTPSAKEKIAQHGRNYRKKHAAKTYEKNREWQRKQAKTLGGSYVRHALRGMGIEASPAVVAIKREQLLLRRLAVEMQSAAANQKEHDEPVTKHT